MQKSSQHDILSISWSSELQLTRKQKKKDGCKLVIIFMTKANILQKNTFTLASQCEKTGDKQHEIDTPNVNLTLPYPTQTIFHWLKLGIRPAVLTLCPTQGSIRIFWFLLGMSGYNCRGGYRISERRGGGGSDNC